MDGWMMMMYDDDLWMAMINDEGVTPLRIPLRGWLCACDACPGKKPSETLESCLEERRQIC